MTVIYDVYLSSLYDCEIIHHVISCSHSCSQTYNNHSMTKPTKWSVRPAKTQISLGIRPVWSESSLCAQWVAKDPSIFMWTVKTMIRLGGCPGWSESSLGAHAILFVLSWGSSKDMKPFSGNVILNVILLSLCLLLKVLYSTRYRYRKIATHKQNAEILP